LNYFFLPFSSGTSPNLALNSSTVKPPVIVFFS